MTGFIQFVRNGEKSGLRNFINENGIILNAFTKYYAIPGLRLGYAVFGDELKAEKVRSTGQFWSVSSAAQDAGCAALDEKEHYKDTVGYVENERTYLIDNLSNIGIKAFSSDANFILIRSCVDLDKKMLQEKILIRNCKDYRGLGEGYFRIAVRTHKENILLINALRRCLNG